MTRNILLGVSALILATLLIMACGALLLRLSGVGAIMSEAAFGVGGDAVNQAVTEGRDPDQTLRTALRWLDFVVYPFAVVAAGIFVGLFVKHRAWPVIAIALSPLVIAFVAGRSWAVRPLGLGLLYVVLACASGQAIVAMRARASS
jgi:hypothetical protein